MNLIGPNEFFEKVKLKVKKEWEIAFFSSIILGLVIHMYIIVNNFPNHDGLYNIYNSQNNIYNGRWFLMYGCALSSFFTLPWVIGIISILCLAFVSVSIVELFDVRNKITIIFISAILCSFPTIGSFFAYMFTADGYMIALLLASVSVTLTYKYRNGFAIGSILLAFSMGIYQAFLSFAIVLCIIKILLSILNQKHKKSLFIEILKNVLMIFMGFVIYYVILNVLLKLENATLSSYQGVDAIQTFNLNTILRGILSAYRGCLGFIIKSSFLKNNVLIIICNLLVVIMISYMIIKHYIKNKLYRSLVNNILMILLLIVTPIAMNIINLISSEVFYHLLMRYHWCLIYIVLLILLEKYYLKENLLQWVSIIALMCIIFNYFVIINISYFNLEEKFEKSYSLGLRIVDEIEECKDYNTGMHVAILGRLSEEKYPPTDITEDILYNFTGSEGNDNLFDPYHYESLFKNYFNYTIIYASEEEIEQVIKSEEYEKMNEWPEEGCIKVIDNILVVNLSKVTNF